MPRPSASALREFMTVRDARNLEEYLTRFEVTLSVMQRADALERIAYELAEDAHREGVWYLEVRFSPVLNVQQGLGLDEVVGAVWRGLERAERELGIVARVIITALRTLPPDVSLELARLAVAHRGRGVVAFDLAGGEAGYPASRHAAAFEHARAHDLACTCHAGEGDGAQSIREAVHTCCANRIGHGTRLFEDRALLDYVNDRRIPIEICLTSNVQTRAANSYADHPLRRYYDAGLSVVLSTDNRLMSDTTLTDEYVHAAADLGLAFDDLATIAINGFESAFLPWRERVGLMARARETIALLRDSATS
jgi:adenosine deaminase